MITIADPQDFGLRELRIAAELLAAFCQQPPRWLRGGLHLTMNTHNGNVFLTDEDFNVAMLNCGALDAWLFTPYDGHEGFLDELIAQFAPDDLHPDDAAYLRYWAEALEADLPEAWLVVDEE